VTAASDRPTLTQAGLRRAAADLPWRQLEVVAATGSTNADILQRSAQGAAEGLVIAADEQTAGRGRLGRAWSSPPGASVSVSVLLRPGLAAERMGWLPLLTGLAISAAIAEVCEVEALLKWPNDVLLDDARPGKVAGILLERDGDAACVGFGINTAMTESELPVPEASSLVLAGAAPPDPDRLVAACLRELHHRYSHLLASGGDPVRSGLADEYSARCTTLDRPVEVRLPGDQRWQGTAVAVDESGRLQVDVAGELREVAAGDVVHLR
jgi:BirA family biotin operon repressor/biotin-[acetyl-CoA-carboxylase] ligase